MCFCTRSACRQTLHPKQSTIAVQGAELVDTTATSGNPMLSHKAPLLYKASSDIDRSLRGGRLPLLLQECVDALQGVTGRLVEARANLKDVRAAVELDLGRRPYALTKHRHGFHILGGELVGADVHENGWKAANQLGARVHDRDKRICCCGDLVPPTEVEVSAELPVEVRQAGLEVQPQPWRDADACNRLLFLELGKLDHQGKGQVGARGIAGHCHRPLAKAIPCPMPGCKRLIQAGRKLDCRRLAIIHCDDSGLCCCRQAADELLVGAGSQQPMTAAMEVEDHPRPVGARGCCHDTL
mmetsp:Transcript_30793/g.102561  ORF Transcript_30793/g.102561 Transcript_30793/m.102561 type:complete len:298 (+) Transcript_30793:75-968(+)